MKTLSIFLTMTACLLHGQMIADNPRTLLAAGSDQREALKVNDGIYQATGFGNSFLVTTPEGNVIIDTSSVLVAPRHLKLLKAVSSAPVKYIILTHGHGDHAGGVPLWKEAGTKVIAQRESVEFMDYQKRLERFFGLRNSAQFGYPIPPQRPWAGNSGGMHADILFDDKYEFTLGGVRFQVMRTPGETPDHLTVWIPEYKAAFTGDNYYESFPNLYTLRGTKPRWALEYIDSLNKVMALKPEFVLPSHGLPIQGNAEITRKLTQSRDAIQYVHDEVVKGMNAGKDVWALMREIKLPKELEVGESYGKLTWSIRGIYAGYAGWFDMDPASMYDVPPSAAYADLVRLAGGPGPVVKLALERVSQGREAEALHLTGAVLVEYPANRAALAARLKALESLRSKCRNSNERGWLDYSITSLQKKI